MDPTQEAQVTQVANQIQFEVMELNMMIENRTQRINEKTQQIESTQNPFRKERYRQIVTQLTADRIRFEKQREVYEKCGENFRKIRETKAQLKMARQTPAGMSNQNVPNANQINQLMKDADEAVRSMGNLFNADEMNRMMNDANNAVNALLAPVVISDAEVAADVNEALGLPQPN